MSAQGFRYIPNPPVVDGMSGSRVSPMFSALPVPYLADDREVVERDGYGVWGTLEERNAALGVTDDPNVAYQATLSPAEADKYSRALFGDYDAPGLTSTGGCSGKGHAQFPEVATSDRRQAFGAEFGDLFYAAWNVVRTDDAASEGGLALDSRFIQLNAEWEACMNVHGYVLEGVRSTRGPGLAFGLAVITRPDGTVGQIHYGDVPLNAIPAEERSLLGSEPGRKVAVADFDCRVETDYMSRLAAIRVSLDEQFIAEH